MIKLTQILSEIEFFTYHGMVSVSYNSDELTKVKLAELLRALPGVNTVTFGTDLGQNRHTFKIKVISQKGGTQAFQAFKQNAVSKYPPIVSVMVDANSIEKK